MDESVYLSKLQFREIKDILRFESVGVAKLYDADGYKNPNDKVSFGSKVSLDGTTEKKTTETTTKTKSQKDYDKDKIPDYRDKCKTKPETYNGYKDTDGCPDKKPKKQLICQL